MTALEIYLGSDGEATKALYARLEQLGPVGIVALNLFRAQKSSERAKHYRRRFKGMAYEKKQWRLGNLCDALAQHGAALGIRHGWKQDPMQPYYPWVLYVDLQTGQQASFHSPTRGSGPDYPGDWDHEQKSAQRIIAWVDRLIGNAEPERQVYGKSNDERQAGLPSAGQVNHQLGLGV